MKQRCRRKIEPAQDAYRCLRYPGRLADVLEDEPREAPAHRHGPWWFWAAAATIAIACGLWWAGGTTDPAPAPAPPAPPTVVDQTPTAPDAAKPVRLVRPRQMTAFSWPRLRPRPAAATAPPPVAPAPHPAPPAATPDTTASPAADTVRVAALRPTTQTRKPKIPTPRLRAAIPQLRSNHDGT